MRTFIKYVLLAAILGALICFLVELIVNMNIPPAGMMLQSAIGFCTCFTIVYVCKKFLALSFRGILLVFGAILLLQAVTSNQGVYLINFGSDILNWIILPAIFWLYYLLLC